MQGKDGAEPRNFVAYVPGRKALIWTNVLILAVGVAVTAYSGYLIFLVQTTASTGMTAVGSMMVVFAIFGFVAARSENTKMLLGYFYSCIFLVSMILLFSIGALLFQRVLETYIDQNWEDTTSPVYRLRNFDCCKTPSSTKAYLEKNLDVLGALGFAAVATLTFAAYSTVKLISVPIVMKNMLVVINVIFMLIGVCVAGYAIYVTQNSQLEEGAAWIAYLFLSMGLFLVFYPSLGIIGARTKNRKYLTIYELCNVLMLLLLLTCAIGGFAFASELEERYENTPEEQIGEMACNARLPRCSNCTATTPASVRKCPEWTKKDVEIYVETNLGYLSLLSVLSMVFLLVGTGGAHVLRKSLAEYQCQSI